MSKDGEKFQVVGAAMYDGDNDTLTPVPFQEPKPYDKKGSLIHALFLAFKAGAEQARMDSEELIRESFEQWMDDLRG